MKYVPATALRSEASQDAIVRSVKTETIFEFMANNVKRAPAALRPAKLMYAWPQEGLPPSVARRNGTGNSTSLAQNEVFSDLSAAVKRVLDVFIAGSAIILLSPILIGILAVIRLDSRGPAIFSQVRVGKDKKLFNIYKFRSMHANAESQRAQLLSSSDRQGLCFKAKADTRITRVGRFLRRWSLDELPQIINVLKGEMSIVGPRPALPEEVAAYPEHALGRLIVKPGITGVWQVSGRADIDFDKMIDLDLAYIRERSTLLDIMLIALTFRAVLSGRGAY